MMPPERAPAPELTSERSERLLGLPLEVRIQELERLLASERSARERAERALDAVKDQCESICNGGPEATLIYHANIALRAIAKASEGSPSSPAATEPETPQKND